MKPPDDRCEWEGCEQFSTRTIYGVTVKPPNSPSRVYVDDVHLCGGHFEIAQRLGHLNLDWGRVLKAMEI